MPHAHTYTRTSTHAAVIIAIKPATLWSFCELCVSSKCVVVCLISPPSAAARPWTNQPTNNNNGQGVFCFQRMIPNSRYFVTFFNISVIIWHYDYIACHHKINLNSKMLISLIVMWQFVRTFINLWIFVAYRSRFPKVLECM